MVGCSCLFAATEETLFLQEKNGSDDRLIVTLSSEPKGEEELQLKLLIDKQQIEERIIEMAEQLQKDYEGRSITIVMIMKGSFIFVADLMRHLDIPTRLSFVQCCSYHGMKKGELSIIGLENIEVKNRHLLVIDDIFDTGHTLSTVVEALQEKGPASIHSLVVLQKEVPRQITYLPDYRLFDIENRFIIGYGLDYKQYCRGLPSIYTVQ